MSSMSNISDLKHDYEDEACSSEGPERDILMEFVMMEEREEDRRKGTSPFRGYAEKVKAKVIREYVGGNRDRKRWGKDKEGGEGGAVGGAAAAERIPGAAWCLVCHVRWD